MNTKTIDVWARNDIYEILDEEGVYADDISILAQSTGIRVTIVEGHLSELLRWRKVREEEPEVGKDYVVSGLGVCHIQIIEHFNTGWVSKMHPKWYYVNEFDTYRPAIPGIDYVEGL